MGTPGTSGVVYGHRGLCLPSPSLRRWFRGPEARPTGASIPSDPESPQCSVIGRRRCGRCRTPRSESLVQPAECRRCSPRSGAGHDDTRPYLGCDVGNFEYNIREALCTIATNCFKPAFPAGCPACPRARNIIRYDFVRSNANRLRCTRRKAFASRLSGHGRPKQSSIRQSVQPDCHANPSHDTLAESEPPAAQEARI